MAAAIAMEGPTGWWWLSFTDPDRPTGQQALGACMVEATNEATAMVRAHELGINPGGQIALAGPLQKEQIPPEQPLNRLLSREEVAAVDALIAAREANERVMQALDGPPMGA